MNLRKLKNEISFLKDRLIALERSLEDGGTNDVLLVDDDAGIRLFINENMKTWVKNRFISRVDMKNGLFAHYKIKLSSYKFNLILKDECKKNGLTVVLDKSKRLGSRVVKGYEIY